VIIVAEYRGTGSGADAAVGEAFLKIVDVGAP